MLLAPRINRVIARFSPTRKKRREKKMKKKKSSSRRVEFFILCLPPCNQLVSIFLLFYMKLKKPTNRCSVPMRPYALTLACKRKFEAQATEGMIFVLSAALLRRIFPVLYLFVKFISRCFFSWCCRACLWSHYFPMRSVYKPKKFIRIT